jgi:hypothetical protein
MQTMLDAAILHMPYTVDYHFLLLLMYFILIATCHPSEIRFLCSIRQLTVKERMKL